MAKALAVSVAANSPQSALVLHDIDDPDGDVHLAGPRAASGYLANARKTKHQARIVEAAADGELIGFLDADTFVLRELADVAELAFDLAITVKPAGVRYPINTGVTFARVSPRVRVFYRRWYEAVIAMLQDRPLLKRWSSRFGGINQSALGYLLDEHDLTIARLPCKEWNATRDSWPSCDSNTRVVHLLSSLRDACVGRGKYYNASVNRLAALWREYDGAAQEGAA